jgi:hypothetical protein
MSLFAMIFVLMAIFGISNVLKRSKKNDEKSKQNVIVGHTSAMEERPTAKKEKTEKPMATPLTPQFDPVFLKEEDWSSYDSPAFYRKVSPAKDSVNSESTATAQKKSRKQSPKQSMEEFKSLQRRTEVSKVAKKGSYEEI